VTGTRLARYYRTVDEGPLDAALALLEERVRFVVALPSGAIRGSCRSDMADYLYGRGVSDRRHVLLRDSVDDDLEFVYGKVTEGDGVTTGYFLAAARIGAGGLIASYQVTFETEHVLIED
jgi:hypothetical protein